MIVGVMTLDLYSGSTHSLKEKRRLVSGLKERLRRRFNAAVIESGHLDSWQQARISLAMLAQDRKTLDQALSHVEDFVAETYPMFSVRVEREFL
ncbi:MAG: DUF503 domain-containing protein [Acidobacteriota bacterium]|jgi:uncharacterized protein YlxP (DUF503 family)|nr:DUF503 domain-containing protein [Acidobacteriota bacterium]